VITEDELSATIRTRLARIGNSQGIRIPRVVVKQAGLQESSRSGGSNSSCARPRGRVRAGTTDSARWPGAGTTGRCGRKPLWLPLTTKNGSG